MTGYRNPFEGQREPLPPDLAEAGFRQEFADLDGVVLHYVRGRDVGLPLVLVPGQMSLWSSYRKVMPALARQFTVYAIDVRGHGNSSWTPGDYSWDAVGTDIARFLRQVVGRPAIVSGNSSGGVLALWSAANAPEHVAAIVLEDPPIFSVEMPRFRDRDRWVHGSLAHAVDVLGDLERPRPASILRQDIPVSETRTVRLPDRFVDLLDRLVARHRRRHPDRPASLGLGGWPGSLDERIRAASMFDPDFARAFLDGRFYGDFSHEDALRRTTCPVLLLHADWNRYEAYGLVGAMDDDDARRVRELAPRTVYHRIHARHVIHGDKPEEFITAVTRFGGALPVTS
ncbi:alpha/beta fold hydrolase [Saccharothrix australiensis]|uniref:Pimeloyl-ACP methyl ester carboxylesterase n=1 Tax=Saccharothrix australiensis TaxID=2072 RepID=A0A495VYR9_9PSEU|nr:alpha/beta hydrolase [Saccharothrix australiensis]RKT54344.1 pimeloyl-ACP methyl ester carboxylesterase [Saccharothrix australiensis]